MFAPGRLMFRTVAVFALSLVLITVTSFVAVTVSVR